MHAQGECADTYSSFSESEDEDTSQRMLEQLGVLSAVLPWDPASNSSDPSGAASLLRGFKCWHVVYEISLVTASQAIRVRLGSQTGCAWSWQNQEMPRYQNLVHIQQIVMI